MPDSFENSFYSGTSGIVVPVSQELYPDAFMGKSRLTYYASLFNSIEINSSFYKLPKASTIIKWREMVPENFQFTFKLSKTISHSKGLYFNADEVALFIQTIENVDKKKGCILVQLPPALKPQAIKQLEKLCKTIDTANAHRAWKIAVEFRNKVWYNDQTFELLKQYNFSLVLHDLPASFTPFTIPLTNVIYLRFHGTEKSYRGSYSAEFLSGYAQRIRQWAHEEKCVYCYFNNTLGDAFNDLQTLNGFVRLG
ncbi:MAG: DUF72 domain-containing protein [Parafilimonas sp.]